MSRKELNDLFQKLLPLGQDRLRTHTDFLPFAAAMDREGNIKYIGPDTVDSYPEPPDTVHFLVTGLQKQAEREQIKASAIIAPVRLTLPDENEESDALQFDLEHREGTSINVMIPFEEIDETGEVRTGEVLEMEVESKIFQP